MAVAGSGVCMFQVGVDGEMAVLAAADDGGRADRDKIDAGAGTLAVATPDPAVVLKTGRGSGCTLLMAKGFLDATVTDVVPGASLEETDEP